MEKIVMDILPTPQKRDWKGVTNPGVKKPISGNTYGETLPDAVAKIGLLPTPTKSDNCARGNQENWDGSDLVSTIHKDLNQPGTTSQLNHRFVLEMMGFPPDWTELPFLNSVTNPSKQPETP
jgi:hypothetical protein